jgi:dsRNA-specific ribonuclease
MIERQRKEKNQSIIRDEIEAIEAGIEEENGETNQSNCVCNFISPTL